MPEFTWTQTSIENPGGERLAACILSAPLDRKGWVVVCHGFTGSKEGGGKSMHMAETLAAQTGYSFVLFDFAGNGESDGHFQDTTLTGQIQDLSAVIDWCIQHQDLQVVTMGRSFGGSTVLAQAAGDTRVRAVCTWAAPVHLEELFSGFVISDKEDEQGRILLADAEGTLPIKKAFMHDLQGHDLLQAAAFLTPRPLLVIHGENDDVVPVHEAEELYAAAQDPKEKRIIPGADHQFSASSEQVWTIVSQWLTTLPG